MIEIIVKNNIDKNKIEALLQFLDSLNIEAKLKMNSRFNKAKNRLILHYLQVFGKIIP